MDWNTKHRHECIDASVFVDYEYPIVDFNKVWTTMAKKSLSPKNIAEDFNNTTELNPQKIKQQSGNVFYMLQWLLVDTKQAPELVKQYWSMTPTKLVQRIFVEALSFSYDVTVDIIIGLNRQQQMNFKVTGALNTDPLNIVHLYVSVLNKNDTPTLLILRTGHKYGLLKAAFNLLSYDQLFQYKLIMNHEVNYFMDKKSTRLSTGGYMKKGSYSITQDDPLEIQVDQRIKTFVDEMLEYKKSIIAQCPIADIRKYRTSGEILDADTMSMLDIIIRTKEDALENERVQKRNKFNVSF
jgi:hypothetical protein